METLVGPKPKSTNPLALEKMASHTSYYSTAWSSPGIKPLSPNVSPITPRFKSIINSPISSPTVRVHRTETESINTNKEMDPNFTSPNDPPQLNPQSRRNSIYGHQHTLSAPHLTYAYDTSLTSSPLSYQSRPLYPSPPTSTHTDLPFSPPVRPNSSLDFHPSPPLSSNSHRRGSSLGAINFHSSPGNFQPLLPAVAPPLPPLPTHFKDFNSNKVLYDQDPSRGKALNATPSAHTPPIGTLNDLKDGPGGKWSRPGYAYVTLIRYAVLGSPHQRLTLGEIYECIEERYPFYKSAGKGWKNSIRHNLSLNKCFKKVARHVLDPGKGSYWTVDLEEEVSTTRHRVRKRPIPVYNPSGPMRTTHHPSQPRSALEIPPTHLLPPPHHSFAPSWSNSTPSYSYSTPSQSSANGTSNVNSLPQPNYVFPPLQGVSGGRCNTWSNHEASSSANRWITLPQENRG